MYFCINGRIWDPGFDLLSELYEFMDARLVALSEAAAATRDAESLGIYDSMEYLSGIAAVALQTYITDMAAFAGLKKHQAYIFGTKTASGKPKIEILNAVANFWKHREEWVFEGGEKRRASTNLLFSEVGYSTDIEYPISGVITEVLVPDAFSFASILPIVTSWRDDMVKSISAQQGYAPVPTTNADFASRTPSAPDR